MQARANLTVGAYSVAQTSWCCVTRWVEGGYAVSSLNAAQNNAGTPNSHANDLRLPAGCGFSHCLLVKRSRLVSSSLLTQLGSSSRQTPAKGFILTTRHSHFFQLRSLSRSSRGYCLFFCAAQNLGWCYLCRCEAVPLNSLTSSKNHLNACSYSDEPMKSAYPS